MLTIQARNYTPAAPGVDRRIDVIVIHDMESPEAGDTAESCGTYFHNQPRSNLGSSAHYCVDSNSVVRCVADRDIAWHAPGANTHGIGVEHAGRASQTRSEWLDAYGKAMLDVSANLVAKLCKQYGIPVKHLTPAQLRSGQKGIVGHDTVTAAYPAYGNHTDPGKDFPWDYYLDGVRHYLNPDPVGTALRQRTGYYSWLAWTLGEDDWAEYGPSNPALRPNVPARISADWWNKRERFLRNRTESK